jgi:hypothetical protein
MKYRFYKSYVVIVVLAIFSTVLCAAIFFGNLTRERIKKSEIIQFEGDVLTEAPLACKVDIEGIFKFVTSDPYNFDNPYIYANLKLVNYTNRVFLPQEPFKIGLRWGGAPSRDEQHRINFPNEMRPGESLEFKVRIPITGWENPKQFIILELMREGIFWCSDYGGPKLIIFKEKSGLLMVNQLERR